MKVGILTFFNAHNYGAVWQAFALKKYMQSIGNDCCIINYRNKYIEKAYPKKLRPRIRKKNYVNPKHFKQNLKEIDVWLHSRKVWESQHRKFEQFIDEYLLDGRADNWQKQIEECDILIFGSDQVWERNIIGPCDRVFIGDFETDARKVSYAASCFSEKSSIDSALIKSLQTFYRISVRESKLADILSQKLGDNFPVETVMDPVFLLGARGYDKFFPKVVKCHEPYILFYMVSEDDELSKMSTYLRTILNKKVIEIHYYKSKTICEEWQRADVGPEEFLMLIQGASFIYTNSFHGTAFSIILKKSFVSVNSNMRIRDLLESVCLGNRIILSLDELKLNMPGKIDYDYVDIKINYMLEKSINFLNEAVGVKKAD